MFESHFFILFISFKTGLSIPLGGLISGNKALREFCLKNELDSFMTSFGGGALLAAVSLVLLPEGLKTTSMIVMVISFSLGGMFTFKITKKMAESDYSFSQLVSMLMDFIPETIILGNLYNINKKSAYFLAVLIILQNMPESFSAFHEMEASGVRRKKIWKLFILMPLLGVLSTAGGYFLIDLRSNILASFMVFCSGAIVYLTFQSIAPQAHQKNRYLPNLGAVLGFLLGLIGSKIIH